MPTLFRLLVAIAFIVGLGYAAMFALAVLVEPTEREVTVRVPTRDLLPDASR
ncbi:histidine kinase [Pelagibacterium sp. 26DY04]|uniref:histidine kinase n=1 Tax=unclassified Pelagibacterium TaxID=2623280 RepID=UPI0028155473|nr:MULTISPECIES: histidine kinase [unclassified Pelagibacterium]WMT86605.1 histidine kinase [Pelagibacterium sp. 26DY04]WMT89248.1 histidine kinase [Pelagibacterium sp. H642]